MSWIHTHVILPLAEPERHAGLAARIHAIRRFERLPEKEQRAEQGKRLRRLLQHAYDTVPFHRKRFDDAGFHPSAARADRPLPLPALCRDDLRDNGQSLLSTAHRIENLRRAGSSGTTSTPVQFYRDIESLRDKSALQHQLNSWAGYNAGDSVLMLWGAHRDLAMQPSWRWRLYEQVLMRQIAGPSGIINDDILQGFGARYEQHRPKVLYAYSTVLAAFASYMQKRGLKHRPQVIIGTAEVMNQENRDLIESVFGVPVTMHYGSREVGMVGAECWTHEGLHFHPWSTHVEFDPIGDTPDGPAYRLLITDLLNYGQPFIRYDTGDCVTLRHRRCSCGRWFPQVNQVLGRVCEGIVMADGGIVPGITLGTQMAQMGHTFRAIAQVQFVQKSIEHLHLRYAVKDESAAKQTELDSIRRAIDALMNQPMNWTFEQVVEIPRERSGKVRLCVSEISPLDSGFGRFLLTPERQEEERQALVR
jgi:phenylacetate-CoA ligase